MLIIDSVVKEIENKYRVIRDINFSRDIDTERSDTFNINENKGFLEVPYKPVIKIRPEDYSIIYGEKSVIEDEVILISTLNDMTDNKVKRAQILLETSFNLNDINVFDVTVKLCKDTNLFFKVNNSHAYRLMLQHKNKSIFLG